MKLKKGDFVELEYVGKLSDGTIFDVTSAERAKKEGLYREQYRYGPRIICLGEGNIVRGIDEFLIGKEHGSYTLSLVPEQAFGKKNAKLMKIVPLQTFTKEKIKPFPGLQVNMDGFLGIVKTVSGGRVIVDFNHPLAGKDIVYELIVKRVITDAPEKIAAYLTLLFGQKVPHMYDKGTLTIHIPLPEQLQQEVEKKLRELIPEITQVRFTEEKKTEQITKKASVPS